MKDALFHPKVWLFENNRNVVAAHGSSNVTYAGIRKNIEQIAVSKSWQDPNQRYITDKLRYEFGRLWENKDDNCIVIGMPEAVRLRLLQRYSSQTPPTEDDLREVVPPRNGGSGRIGAVRVHACSACRFRLYPTGSNTKAVRSSIRARLSRHGATPGIAACWKWRPDQAKRSLR